MGRVLGIMTKMEGAARHSGEARSERPSARRGGRTWGGEAGSKWWGTRSEWLDAGEERRGPSDEHGDAMVGCDRGGDARVEWHVLGKEMARVC